AEADFRQTAYDSLGLKEWSLMALQPCSLLSLRRHLDEAGPRSPKIEDHPLRIPPPFDSPWLPT
ncbi:MAG: hypothetical protein AAB308_13280, partial [Nitrospirota bacterium]